MALNIEDKESLDYIEFDDSINRHGSMYVDTYHDSSGIRHVMCLKKEQAEQIIKHLKEQFGL